MRYLRRQVDLDRFKDKSRRKRKRRLLIALGALVFVSIVVGSLIAFKGEAIRALFAPISFVARLVNPVELKEHDGRVNVLVLGLDTRGNGGLMNTDTILVGSLSKAEGKPVLVSIPRDFWVNLSPFGWGRINAAYSRGGTQKDGTFNEEQGVEFALAKVKEVLGIEIPYYAVVDFEGFIEIIDTLGGVEICVDQAFDDYAYPVPGRETALPISSRYEHLHFDAGCQQMDGELALKFARSRSGTNGEGNDFARVRRQQKTILAVKDAIFSADLLFKPAQLAKLYGQLSETIKTNATLGEVEQALELAGRFEDLSTVNTLILDPESGLVYHPTNTQAYGGAYVLVPQGGNFEKIHAAVRELFYGGEQR
ncbi:hypothetical protein GTO10_02305 [Candidatus Saccharibacteria bacterium]|nr:hypothetical protein [Candidatus Saccharibacteria bacterium]